MITFYVDNLAPGGDEFLAVTSDKAKMGFNLQILLKYFAEPGTEPSPADFFVAGRYVCGMITDSNGVDFMFFVDLKKDESKALFTSMTLAQKSGEKKLMEAFRKGLKTYDTAYNEVKLVAGRPAHWNNKN